MKNSELMYPDISKIVRSILGFAAVAMLTAMAGYSLGNFDTPVYQRTPLGLAEFFTKQPGDLPFILLYILIILPYYYHREASLERMIKKNAKGEIVKFDNYVRLNGIQNPIWAGIIFLGIGIGVCLLFVLLSETYRQLDWVRIFFCFVLALYPFGVLFVRTLNRLKAPGDLEFSFNEKVLLPALTTGIVPFSFGWAISTESVLLFSVVLSSLFILAIVFLTRRYKNAIAIASGALLLFGVVTFAVPEAAELRIIVYGSIITLAMGVSEIRKRVFTSSKFRYYFTDKEDANFYLAGSNWSSVIYPLLLSVVPLLLHDFPVVPILGFITIQSLSWLYLTNRAKRSPVAASFSVLLGYALPLLFIVVPVFGVGDVTIPARVEPLAESFSEVTFNVALFILGIVLTIVAFRPGKKFNLNRFLARQTYLNKTETYFLFFISLCALIVLVSLVSTVISLVSVGNEITNEIRSDKIAILLWASIMIMIVLLGYVPRLIRGDGNEKIQTGKSSRRTRMTKTRSVFKELVISARPVTSIVAAAATFAFLSLSSQFDFISKLSYSFPILLITACGFLINDIFDYEKDKKGEMDRPIASGRLKRSTAKLCAAILALVGLLYPLLVFGAEVGVQVFIIFVGVFVYSLFARRLPVLKGVATSLLTISPLFYSTNIVRVPIPTYVYAAIFLFILGRELLLDTKHFANDLRANFKTIVYYIGKKKAEILSWLLMFFAVAYYLSNVRNYVSFLIVLAGLANLFLSLFIDIKYRPNNGGLTVATMILCVVSVPFLV